MKRLPKWAIGLFAWAAVVVWRWSHPSGQVVAELIFGWIRFIAQVAPGIRINWSGMAVFGIGLLTVSCLGHSILGWLFRSWHTGENSVWRLRWTVALTASVVDLFAAGVAMIGATHQLAWLARSDTALFGEGVHPEYGTPETISRCKLSASRTLKAPTTDFPLTGLQVRSGNLIVDSQSFCPIWGT